MRQFFVNIYRFFTRRQWLLWTLFSVVVLVAAWGVTRLRFVEDISSFLPQNEQNSRINRAYQHIGADNKIIIDFHSEGITEDIDYDLLTESVNDFAACLQRLDSGKHIKKLLYEIDPTQINEITSFIVQNMPLFLTEEDYARLDTLLDEQHIQQQLQNDRAILSSPAGVMRNILSYDPLLITAPILQKLSDFQLDERYQEQDGYIFNREGTDALVIVTSKYPMSETAQNGLLIEEINAAIDSTLSQYGNSIVIHSFGASLVSQTNANQIKKDSLWAIVLALSFIVALLFYFYRNLKSIFFILCAITFGALLSIGFIVWIKNPISIIALGAASIIIGIAINYPIHFLAHFKRTDNKEQIIKEIVNPLLIGNITTVGAFLSLLFISSDAMRDLGLLAALLLIGTILFVLVFLPHLLGKRRISSHEYELSFKKVAEFAPEKNKYIVLGLVLLTIIFAFFSTRTSFETDMQKINYMTDSQRAYFEQLRAETDTTVQNIYCVAEGRKLDEALQNYELAYPHLNDFVADSIVKKMSGISIFVPSQEMQTQRIKRWNNFWESRHAAVVHSLDKAASANGFNPQAFTPFKELLNQEWEPQTYDYFEPIVENLASSYIAHEEDITLVYTILSVDKSKYSEVENTLNNIDDQVFAFTDNSVISRMVAALSHDFDYVLYICGLIVFAFLFFSFRRLEIAITAFLPLTLAWIWILGLMGIFDLKFNIVNIILATFIFGQGDDYTIFVTEGVIYEYCYGKKMLSQFKNSIILSSSIMFIGIGMLIFAKHPAMRSLAEVTIVGMFSVVMMAYILPPLIFRYLTTKNGKPRKEPITLWKIFKTFTTLLIFSLGSIFLTLVAFIFQLFFRKNDKIKLLFHRILHGVLTIISKNMFEIPFKIKNPHHETFDKPAIIISNHQSFADILFGLTLTPKMIAMTNQKVWNYPLFRSFIRYADFFPNDGDLNKNLDNIKKMIQKGYSILIFPEGTRSLNEELLRFHQGAFYLADQLQVDILPIVMHGMGHAWPKKECMQYAGGVTITIEERIKPDNKHFRNGQPLLKQTQLFRQYYREMYEKVEEEFATPAYYKDMVWHNYIYKGREVQMRARKALRNFSEMEAQIARLPAQGKILIKEKSQGEFSLLTALVKKHLQIVSVIEDDDTRAIAEHCAAVPDNLQYCSQVDVKQHFDMIIK